MLDAMMQSQRGRSLRRITQTDTPVNPYRSKHCHCSALVPDDDLITTCSNGAPSRRYKEALEEGRAVALVSKEVSLERRRADESVEKEDLMKEITKFRKCYT